MFAVNKGYLDDVEVTRALAFEVALRAHVKSKFKDLFDRIESSKDLSADDEKALGAAIEDFKKNGDLLSDGEPIMAGTKEIRLKIKSVQNTRKITKAMEMVAASKMRKAQERMRAGRPYAAALLDDHRARRGSQHRVPSSAAHAPGHGQARRRRRHHDRQGALRRPQHEPAARWC